MNKGDCSDWFSLRWYYLLSTKIKLFHEIDTTTYLKHILPRTDRKKEASSELVSILRKIYLNSFSINLTENGRVAQYLFLKSLNLPRDTKVAVQAFTCNASINPILWLGLKPNYIDIDPSTLNMDVEDLKKKIDPQTKVVILQHTFGNPGPIEEVIQICKERGIYLFEDCAHSIGGTYRNRPLGSFGDAALVSFGLEKVLSTRVGGALVLNNKYLGNKIERTYSELKEFSYLSTLLWVLNPVIWRVLRKTGKAQNVIAKQLNKIGLLNLGFYDGEMYGKMPDQYPRKLSETLASIASYELKGLKLNIEHRAQITRKYFVDLLNLDGVDVIEQISDNIPFIRFPVMMKDQQTRDAALEELRKQDVYAGDWYDPHIYPEGTAFESMQYVEGSCPVAEDVSKRILNLPTGQNVTSDEVERILQILGNFS